MEQIIIKIEKSSEDKGYFYDIYETSAKFLDCDPIDGGLIEGTLEETIKTASERTLDIIKDE